MIRGVVALALVVACSSSTPAPGPATSSPPPAADAAIDGSTAIGSTPPGVLDPDPAPAPTARPSRRKPRSTRPIDILLKSTPAYAMAAVDGVQVGRTPSYWSGEADGEEHEFTFVLDGHAVARYRFIPIQSGVVHARLYPVVHPDHPGADAGVVPSAPAPAMPSAPEPDPMIPPPATVVDPPAAPASPAAAPVGPTP
jgi:hypothetical protein